MKQRQENRFVFPINKCSNILWWMCKSGQTTGLGNEHWCEIPFLWMEARNGRISPMPSLQERPVISVPCHWLASSNLLLKKLPCLVFFRSFWQHSQSCQHFSTCICQKPITVRPLNLEAVEANHVFQIHEYYNQAVELISQPEICEAHLVEGSGEHSKLLKEKGIICVTF